MPGVLSAAVFADVGTNIFLLVDGNQMATAAIICLPSETLLASVSIHINLPPTAGRAETEPQN